MYRDILVPLDTQDPVNADAALAHAEFLAGVSEARLHLVHVRLRLPKAYTWHLPEAWNARDDAECRKWLADRVTLLKLPEERMQVHVRQGSVCFETLKLANEVKADLIIVGSHRPSTATRILGSNATGIVRDANVSVLVVRNS